MEMGSIEDSSRFSTTSAKNRRNSSSVYLHRVSVLILHENMNRLLRFCSRGREGNEGKQWSQRLHEPYEMKAKPCQDRQKRQKKGRSVANICR